MSAPDIHPENLLDKLAEGELLNPTESKLLHDHLSDCAACRFELRVRDDLQTEAEALQFDRISVGQLLLALPYAGAAASGGGAQQPVEGDRASSKPAAVLPVRGRFRARPVRVGLAALALASGAAALVAVGMPLMSDDSPPTTPAVIPVAQPGAPKAVARTAPEQGEPKAKIEAKAADAPAHTASPHRASPQTVSPQRVSRSLEKPTPSKGKARTDEPAPAEPSAAELFSEANQARRASNGARATQLYRLLQRKYPGSQEAQLSLVTLASLQLNSGNASGALSTFNRYLSQSGRPLEAEALYGQAQAFRQLGRTSEEVRAWKRLLATHPSSGYAAQARERLSSLGGS